jgi:CheY-like chemotaxis protein
MKTVLVIDDDASFRKLMGKWLTGAGWNVLEAGDGDGGVQLAIERQPDAVVCDLLMPGCNGFQVCRAIREQGGKIHQPKIIVTTGSGYATDQ